MIIYCDNLTIGACIHIIRLNWRNMFYRHNACKIWVLDPLPQRAFSIILRTIMRYLGFGIKEADFFAGHLRLSMDNWSILKREMSNKLSLKAAEGILANSKHLTNLNYKWEKYTFKTCCWFIRRHCTTNGYALIDSRGFESKILDHNIHLVISKKCS